jgi:hypothetical protein
MSVSVSPASPNIRKKNGGGKMGRLDWLSRWPADDQKSNNEKKA